MRMREVRKIAGRWVEEEASSLTGFQGAYLSGSMTALPDDAPLPTASDVDIKLVLDGTDVEANPQKHLYHDLVIDVSCESIENVRSPDAVLGNYFTASHFTHPCIIADPTGHLAEIQAGVQRDFARREWVRRRCEHAREQLQESLTWLSSSGTQPDHVITWLFPIVFTPPMALVADLRNPTHRRGLAVLGQVLARYGHPELHERLLGIVGSAELTRGQVEALLAGCAEAFDVAQAVRTTPFLMASNISDFARPMAIGGAQELIDDGYHREVLPWLAFIHSMCVKVLTNDAPAEVQKRFAPGYERLLAALGVSGYGDMAERNEELGRFAADLWPAVEEIIETDPAIRD